VTIATNMAGRGVDIKLGGNPEGMAVTELRKLGLSPGDESYEEEERAMIEQLQARCDAEAEEVIQAGGLFICGTERHESRRIDNQLRGRSGRQGDPGESRFFLSAEDDLIRLFAGERIYKILDRLGPVNEQGEEEALEAKMLTKTIEGAQKKVEQQNFLIRKRVLEYDDVMNEQRRIVYKYRREILEGKDMSDVAREELAEVVSRLVETYTPGDILEDWDLGELQTQAQQLWRSEVDLSGFEAETTDREDLREALLADALAAYDRREQEFGDEIMRQLERGILLQIIDNRWREHLAEMDYLREGIHLRGFAQIDPLVAYKNEGFSMFEALMNSIWEEFARLIFHVEVEVAPRAQEQFAPSAQPANVELSGGTAEQPSALGQAVVATAAGADVVADQAIEGGDGQGNGAPSVYEQETVVKDEREKIGRNDPCWCGSGKKYKKCHGA
jgi:preprotein translocase subunit SecA